MIRNYLPFMDLWRDLSRAAGKSGHLKPLYQVRDNIQKIRYDASAITVKEDVAVQQIFLITMDNKEDRIEQETITGIAKVRIAKNFTHLDHLVPLVSDAQLQFQYIAKMVTKVPVMRLSRSRLTSLKDFSGYMMQAIGM